MSRHRREIIYHSTSGDFPHKGTNIRFLPPNKDAPCFTRNLQQISRENTLHNRTETTDSSNEQLQGPKEDWLCQLGHPRKIKNLLTYLKYVQ